MNSVNVLTHLGAAFYEQDLPCPWVPPTLANRIIEYAPGMFASRLLGAELYDLELFVAEYLAAPTPEPYVALGFDGHGLVSQAVHYYLADQRVAVFVQQRWGTLFDDPERDRDRFAIMTGYARKLLELAAAAHFLAGEHLIAIQSSFSSSRFGWLREGEVGSPRWEVCSSAPIFAAAALRQRLQGLAGATQPSRPRHPAP